MYQRARCVRVGGKSGNDILDAWVERSYLSTADSFPATHRDSRVVEVRSVLLNPVEVAIVELSKKSVALWELGSAAEAAPPPAPQAFTQTLSGCVDAAVSGGVSNYDPLLTGAFRATHPEIEADLVAGAGAGGGKRGLIERGLLPALQAHVAVLKRCLGIHRDKCRADMMPLHRFLEERLKKVVDMVEVWAKALL